MKKLSVTLRRSPSESLMVGTLADQDRRIYFEYDSDFLDTHLELSPRKLPARRGLIEHTDSFSPLPGVFDDSLPDGWGLLLMDRRFRREGVDPASLSPLDRLAYLGTRTMGALTYHPPANQESGEDASIDLYELGRNAEEVLEGETHDVLPKLMRAGGSPGGARPKVLVGVKGDTVISGEDDLPDGFEHWIVKFAAKDDIRDAGPMEFAYSLMAKAAGLDMPETRLFEVREGSDIRHYFGVSRFDRAPGNRRFHVHTAAGLLHLNFRIPSADYSDLFKVTQALTRNHLDLLSLFRLMVFNVAAHNRDDHTKNFAYILDDLTGDWSLAPAYDLTYEPGPGGEHATTIAGEGNRPQRQDCLRVAAEVGITASKAIPIIEQVNAALDRWSDFASEAGCRRVITTNIAKALAPI